MLTWRNTSIDIFGFSKFSNLPSLFRSSWCSDLIALAFAEASPNANIFRVQ